jgi:hypothetical protein
MKGICLFFLLCSCIFTFAQKVNTPLKTGNTSDNSLQEDRIESLASNNDGEVDYSALTEQLLHYKDYPLNLNKATEEELTQLTFLNGLQINSLQVHIKKFGNLITIFELQAITGFDLNTIYQILPYVSVDQDLNTFNSSFKNIFKDGDKQLLTRIQRVIEPAEGYKKRAGKSNKDGHPAFAGDAFKIYARFRFNYLNKINFGFTCLKSPGEPFLTESSWGFDFNSFHLMVNTNHAVIKSVALGDYQLQFGQGLNIWSGIAYSKSSDVINVMKYGSSVRPYTSSNKNILMRGIAVHLSYKKVSAILFYSSNKMDAHVVQNDSILNDVPSISAVSQTGLHRTAAEIALKQNLDETLFGGHVDFKIKKLTLGFTGLKTIYSMPFEKHKQVYKKFDFYGDENLNLSVDYNLSFQNYIFFGEVGRSRDGGMAGLAGMLVSLDEKVSMACLIRKYQAKYWSPHGNAFGERYKSNNEEGLYAALQYRASREISISLYYDIFSFPWLYYQNNAPSHGQEYLIQINYLPSKVVQAYIRGKFSEKEKNSMEAEMNNPFLSPFNQNNFRLNIVFAVAKMLTLQNRIEGVFIEKEGKKKESGFLMYQELGYKPMNSFFACNFRYTLFDTDSYSSRLYAYENDFQYMYSIPAFFYRGDSFYLNVQCKMVKKLTLWLGYHFIRYDNRISIGTGLDAIEGKLKSEARIQIRLEL